MKKKTKITAFFIWLILAFIPIILIKITPDPESNVHEIMKWYHWLSATVAMLLCYISYLIVIGILTTWLFDRFDEDGNIKKN